MRGPRLTSLRRALLFAFASCATFATAAASAQTQQNQPQTSVELDLPAYEAELDRCADSIKRPEQIPQLRKSLPRTWIVRTGDARIEVSTEWLASDLRKLAREPASSSSDEKKIELRLTARRRTSKRNRGSHFPKTRAPTSKKSCSGANLQARKDPARWKS